MAAEPNGPEPFQARLRQAWPPSRWQEVTVLLAVSGGPDSVALLLGLKSIRGAGGGSLVAAHFHHGTRGGQSDADQAFVMDLCQRLAVPCVTGRRPGMLVSTVESAMREARYDFLRTAAENLAARYLVTAHTADDQAETILHRIIRGTGLRGLAGIPRVRPLSPAVTLVRPMLSIRRDEVLAYLRRMDQPYREDGSNLDRQHTRNRIRQELLPALRTQYNPEVVESLLRLGQLAREAQQALAEQVDALMDECVCCQDLERAGIECAPLANRHSHVVRELLVRVWREQGWPQQAMGYKQWGRLYQMTRQTAAPAAPRMTLPGGVRAHRCGDLLYLRRIDARRRETR